MPTCMSADTTGALDIDDAEVWRRFFDGEVHTNGPYQVVVLALLVWVGFEIPPELDKNVVRAAGELLETAEDSIDVCCDNKWCAMRALLAAMKRYNET